jgi:hypothetical protein
MQSIFRFLNKKEWITAEDLLTKVYFLDTETKKVREIFSDENLPINLMYGTNGKGASPWGMIRIASGHCFAIGFSRGNEGHNSDFRLLELQLDSSNRFREIGDTQTHYPEPIPGITYHVAPEEIYSSPDGARIAYWGIMNGVRGLVFQSTSDGNAVLLDAKKFPLDIAYANLGWLSDSEHMFIQTRNNDNHIVKGPKPVPATYIFQWNGADFKQIPEKSLMPPNKGESDWGYGDSKLLGIQKSGDNIIVSESYHFEPPKKGAKEGSYSMPIPMVYQYSTEKESYEVIPIDVDSYPYNCLIDTNFPGKIICESKKNKVLLKELNSKEEKTFKIKIPPSPKKGQIAEFSTIGLVDSLK